MSRALRTLASPGVAAGLAAAALFGVGTPLAKLLLTADVSPWLLAGLLYCGSGAGLLAYRLATGRPRVRPAASEWGWIAGAVGLGGVLGPVLLMAGLASMPASGASLLLNAEGVFTAVIAWVVFRENVDRRVALGMLAIVAGAAVLSLGDASGVALGAGPGPLLILGACLCWGLDNNLTRRVSLTDATWLAMVKGLVAGPTNLVLAAAAGASWPGPGQLAGALAIGLASYGVSLVLFIVALREVGAARAGAYFGTGPFVGAALAVALGEPLTWQLGVAGALMAAGVALHLTERHEHVHTHAALEHTHLHRHDAHHQHAHDQPIAPGVWHTHPHRHEPVTHAHPHTPDAHHRHRHTP